MSGHGNGSVKPLSVACNSSDSGRRSSNEQERSRRCSVEPWSAAHPPPGRAASRAPRTAQDISPQLDFLYRAESAFSAWVQFADAKAGGVTLLLGIGLLDLIRRSSSTVHAHAPSSARG